MCRLPSPRQTDLYELGHVKIWAGAYMATG
eukprot:SAG22_NODE_15463_length_348_cov_0.875502_1_plen_29_part_10